MHLGGLTKEPELPYQPVEVYVNDQKVADWQLAADPAELSAPIPKEITKARWSPKNYAENSKGDLAEGVGTEY
jgi:hypothetical protein